VLRFYGVSESAVAQALEAAGGEREGVEATIFVNYVDGYKSFSELDRSVLGCLADLASLAVSEKT